MQTTATPTSKDITSSSKATSPYFSQYKPIPIFPQRLVKTSMEKKYKKFLEVLKQLNVNIPYRSFTTNV